MQYTKPALDIENQIKLLEDRGLIVPNRDKLRNYLNHISFYRLRAYTHSFQDNNDINHPFIDGTTFDDVLNLYIFDRELRLLLMDAIERVEIGIRTQIIYHFSITYGSQWYEDVGMFHNSEIFSKDFVRLEEEVNRSSEIFIKHYKRTYNDPEMPPAWMAMEVTSFGLLSKFYDNLKNCDEKKAVARHFGLGHPKVLISWLHTISLIRNIVAHHGRLWNRTIRKTPRILRKPPNTWLVNTHAVQPNKLYLSLSCIQYLLKTVNPTPSFSQRLQDLLDAYPIANTQDMGFPVNWKDEPLWSTDNEGNQARTGTIRTKTSNVTESNA